MKGKENSEKWSYFKQVYTDGQIGIYRECETASSYVKFYETRDNV